MAVLAIRLFPDKILRSPAREVKSLTHFHKQLIQDLIETMHAHPGGIGIAAPQVGQPWQIAIVDVSRKDRTRQRLVLINPEIMESMDPLEGREGCMSLPDYTANVRRMKRVRVRWRDRDFSWRELRTEGVEAICIQHEIDHLNGLLFIDRVSSLRRDVFRRKKYL
jgi:peptide deformylase